MSKNKRLAKPNSAAPGSAAPNGHGPHDSPDDSSNGSPGVPANGSPGVPTELLNKLARAATDLGLNWTPDQDPASLARALAKTQNLEPDAARTLARLSDTLTALEKALADQD